MASLLLEPTVKQGRELIALARKIVNPKRVGYVVNSINDAMKGKIFLMKLSEEEERSKDSWVRELSEFGREDSPIFSTLEDSSWNQKRFDNVIVYLSTSLRYLTENAQFSLSNWTVLKEFSLLSKRENTEWLNTLLSSEIKRCKVGSMIGWSRILKRIGFKEYALDIDVKAEEKRVAELALNSISVDQAQKQLIDIAKRSLQTSAVQPGAPYSSIKLDAVSCSNIISNIGKRYDLAKLIENTDSEAKMKRVDIHKSLIDILNGLKFEKKPITYEMGSKPSKSKLAEKIDLSSAAAFATALAVPIPTKEREVKKLIDLVLERLLLKREYQSLNTGLSSSASSKPSLKLDPWQATMVNAIKENRSILVVGPTSGGKTFTSMAALDWIFSAHSSHSLAYIAPTFHLALQTYANITKSFPQKRVALVTGVINSIPLSGSSKSSGGTIWIGTPNELWNYLQATKEEFTIGIFDEVHTINIDSSEEQRSATSSLVSHSISALMGKCTKQLIALSATISDEDAGKVTSYIKSRCGLEIESIIYRDRVVSITEWYYDGISISKIDSSPKESEISSKGTVEMLHLLKERKMFPTLVFEENDSLCYNNYEDLVEYLQREDSINYNLWHHFDDNYNPLIRAANMEIEEMMYDKKTDKPRNPAQIIPKVSALKSSLCSALSKPFKEIETIDRSRRENLAYATEVRGLMNNLMFGEALATIPTICEGVGPHYRFSEQSSDFRRFRQMRCAPITAEDTKIHNLMGSLLKAEGLEVADMKLLKLIESGLSFGIGIILPTMPFVIQYEMLRLLDSGKLNVVFGSQSLHMGVNYPLRSVVIRTANLKEIDVAAGMQMGGRCGRRRLDTEGHVLYQNVSNASKMRPQYLRALQLPDPSKLILSRIRDPLKVMIDVEMARTLLGSVEIGTVKGRLALIDAIIEPIAESVGFEQVHDLFTRISRLLESKTRHTDDIDGYRWSEKIEDVEKSIGELHLRYHLCSNIDLLEMLSAVGTTLRSAMYRQIRIA